MQRTRQALRRIKHDSIQREREKVREARGFSCLAFQGSWYAVGDYLSMVHCHVTNGSMKAWTSTGTLVNESTDTRNLRELWNLRRVMSMRPLGQALGTHRNISTRVVKGCEGFNYVPGESFGSKTAAPGVHVQNAAHDQETRTHPHSSRQVSD